MQSTYYHHFVPAANTKPYPCITIALLLWKQMRKRTQNQKVRHYPYYDYRSIVHRDTERGDMYCDFVSQVIEY